MSRSGTTCLVTGAAGFIGVNIVKCLALKGYNVIAVDLRKPDNLVEDYLRGLEQKISWHSLELSNFESLNELTNHYEISAIIHAAVVTAVTKEFEQNNARMILNTNLTGTINMLELARISKAKRFVYVSSSGLYGETDIDTPIKEDSQLPYLRMNGFYGITKITCEKLTERYRLLFPMDTTAIRIGSPYGCMERPTGARYVMGPIFELLKLIITERRKVIRVKGLDFKRDWTYVADIAEGLVLALESPSLSQLYNLSSGENHTIGEILEAIRYAGVDYEWEEVQDEARADFVASLPGSIRGPLSIEKIQKELGYKPKYSIAQGIEEYVLWWRNASKKGIWQ